MRKIILDEQTFKIFKKKRRFIYASYDNIIENINAKDKVLVSSGTKDKKRKVIKTYEANNLDELKNILAKKTKYLYLNNLENKQYKVYAIEFKKRLNIIFKIFLIFILLIVSFGLFYLARVQIRNYSTNKIIEEINSVKENEISYVFIEINPKIVLEVKGDVIINQSCLNEDCLNVFNDIEIQNKSIEEAVDILYNSAKEKGIDVTNGVKVSSTNTNLKEKVENIEYSTYQNISKEEEKELITEVIDDTSINYTENQKSYNEELLEVYQSDSAYGDIYTCSIENDELSCYITNEFYNILGDDPSSLDSMLYQFDRIIEFMAVLDKFGIDYTTSGIEGAEIIGLDKITLNKIYINGDYRRWGNGTIAGTSVSSDGQITDKSSFSYKASILLDDYDLGEAMLYNYDFHVLPLNKLNLIDSSYDESDVITF